MSTLRLALLALALTPGVALAQGTGILILAHGGSSEWNARVNDLVRAIDRAQPTEVAFGMATRRTMQDAVDRLNARNVDQIVAVPLFVSSWSSVITSTEYLLGLRASAPAELSLYARMDHGRETGAGDAPHAGHDANSGDGMQPVDSKARITRMTAALNAHPVVADILLTRARAISEVPSQEAVIIAAHGPVSDEENQRWLNDMSVVADRLGSDGRFASVDPLTVKDDAPKPERDRATAELRALVSRRIAEGKRVLIVPLLISFGGIEKGIAERLEGLQYRMADAGLMPDERLAGWVLEMAESARQ